MDRAFLRGSTKRRGVAVVVMVILVFGINDSYAQKTKKVEGLNFQVPEDWPIEKRGGVLGPVPTEEYVSIKFKDIEKEFQDIKSDLANKLSHLQTQLETIESHFSEEIKKAGTQAVPQSGTAAGMAEILPRLEEMESQLGRLDRKLTNKLLLIQEQFELMNTQIRNIEKNFEGLQSQFFKLDEEVGFIAEQQKGTY